MLTIYKLDNPNDGRSLQVPKINLITIQKLVGGQLETFPFGMATVPKGVTVLFDEQGLFKSNLEDNICTIKGPMVFVGQKWNSKEEGFDWVGLTTIQIQKIEEWIEKEKKK